MQRRYDAVVVGAGPNGLTAAAVLARAGLSVLVIEANDTIGGGARTAEVTIPGFRHDICSAIHPMGLISPIFRRLGLGDYVEWVQPRAALAHPLPNDIALLEQSVDATASNLGTDGRAWKKLMKPLVGQWEELFDGILRPMRIPRRPFLMARFGLQALRSARGLANSRFKTDAALALFAGCAAHSVLPLHFAGTASFGLALIAAAHAVGWPLVRGGSQRIVEGLRTLIENAGGEIVTGWRIGSVDELPESRAMLFDVTPRQLARIGGSKLPARYRRKLERYRYGPGVFKIDWALDGPIPWKREECSHAATVHVGGTIEEISTAEAETWSGKHPERPFILVAQQSLFDDSRAPAGKHTGWAYCHVPNGSDVDMTERIERQIERFAPGFRDLILARAPISPKQFEEHNENMIGGDIGGGANNLRQFLMRPFFRLDPYATPNPRIFLCSSSTPPGGGVHGMCGYFAARSAMKRAFRIASS